MDIALFAIIALAFGFLAVLYFGVNKLSGD